MAVIMNFRKIIMNSFFLILIISNLMISCNTTFFYHPTKEVYFSPKTMGFPSNELWIQSKDGTKLHGFHLLSNPNADHKNTIVLFFHGNAENISSHFLMVAWLADKGYDVVLFDYRGYGKSKGEADHAAIQQDVTAMLHYGANLARDKNLKLIVYGQSLGGILAANGLLRWQSEPASSQYMQPNLLILDSTFASYQKIAASKFDGCITLFRWLPYIIVSDRYSAEDIAALAPLPIFVIHGDQDDIVPDRFGRELYELAGNPKRLMIVERAQHAAWAGLGRSPSVLQFLKIVDELMTFEPDSKN